MLMTNQLLRRRRQNFLVMEGFDAAVQYSKRRKTLTIKVEEGKVTVQAPCFVAQVDIENFLRRKHEWILEKLAHQRTQIKAREKTWTSGDRLPWLGKDIILHVEHGSKSRLSFDGRNLLVTVRAASPEIVEQRVQALVQQWYKESAAQEIAQRVAYWQTITGITPHSHRVRTYKSRWGSCSHRKELTFNWKLVMTPPVVLDYVVVHELCHIIHFNHSPEYWRLVERFQPDYKAHKNWLRTHGLSLDLW